MLETSARLLRLLSVLQTPREWSGSELAARLNVTTRTVRRDVDRLRRLGYPVRATAGSAGGYRLEAGTAMPPLLLDDDEAVAVAVGLRTGAAGTVAGIEETSLRALAKLEQVLPARLRQRVNVLQSVTVPLSGPGPTVDPDLLLLIAGACRDRERLRLDYRDSEGRASSRSAEPLRLVQAGRRWYLLAWDRDRDDWRTFRADRIGAVEQTRIRFEPREPPDDIAAYVSRSISSGPYRHHARVTVHAPVSAVAEWVSPVAGYLEAVDAETCVLHTGADSLNSLASHLGALGAEFVIHEPPELIDSVRRLSDRLRRASS